MIMDNYLSYVREYYAPDRHAYVGRVFRTEGNANDPFVSGLSVTLSAATASLLAPQSQISQYRRDDNAGIGSGSGSTTNEQQQQRQQYECSAERFVFGGPADDHTLSRCLGSLGIYPAYTRDSAGHERFMHFSPKHHYGVIGDGSVSTLNVLAKQRRTAKTAATASSSSSSSSTDPDEPAWYAKFNWTPYSSRVGCFSQMACAFHYIGLDKQNSTLVWDDSFHAWRWKTD